MRNRGVTYGEVVALVAVLADVNFSDSNIELESCIVHIDVVVLC